MTPAPSLRTILSDRWIVGILLLGLVFRVALALGLHHHFRDAPVAHLWPYSDEALFYDLGSKSAHALRSDGWQAFLDARPAPEYLNWVFFKYTGLLLYVFGDHPLILRIISLSLEMAGILLLLGAFAPQLRERRQKIFYAGLLALFPSFALWSSMAIKEGLICFLTGLLCWGLVCFWNRTRPWAALAFAAVVCFVLGCFRIWAGVGFFAAASGALMLCHPGKPKLLHLIPAVLAMVVAVWMIPSVQFLITKHVFGWQIRQTYDWKDKETLPRKNPKLRRHNLPELPAKERLGLLEGGEQPIPIKMFVAWLLPLPGVPKDNALVRLSGFENILFLAIFFMAVDGARRRFSPLEWAWLAMGLSVLIVAILVGTNLGTIYRNKISALPFVAYFAACALPHTLASLRALIRRPDSRG